MKKNKFVEQNELEFSILVLSVVIAVLIGLVFAFEDVKNENIYLNILFTLAGVACSQLIFIIKNYRNYKKGLNMAVSCDYHKKLHDLGILKIYPKRRKTEQEEGGYYYELQEELKRLNSKNVPNLDKKIIKMIGVSFDKFFGSLDEDISSIIWELCKKIRFQVMICDPKDNSELNFRLDFINKELEKYHKNKGKNWTDVTKDNAIIFNEIESSIGKIERSQTNGSKIDLCKYKFSPYATMIIIDNHIYYTPNVLEYKSYVPQKLPPEFAIEAELSMCIHRKSEYGERLEKLFDALWDYGHVPIADDDSTAKGKSKRAFFPWSKKLFP